LKTHGEICQANDVQVCGGVVRGGVDEDWLEEGWRKAPFFAFALSALDPIFQLQSFIMLWDGVVSYLAPVKRAIAVVLGHPSDPATPNP
jgi:hypothetical protein